VDSLKRIIINLVQLILKQRYIRSAILKALEEPREPRSYKSFGRFVDSQGNSFQLLENYRNHIWPGWQKLVSYYASLDRPSQEKVIRIIDQAKTSVQSCLELLRKHSIDIKGKNILEVGCYNGAKAFQLLQLGICSVTGSDMSRYYLSKESSQNSNYLDKLREFFGKQILSDENTKNKVEFVEDDICQSKLPLESYDVIVSWDVLEHISNPRAAIQNIYNLLKPEGITYHVYHSFFCLTGGHGFCTLDFPWGHTRLNSEDFARYVKHWRPDEAELSLKYYNNSLNRLTIGDFESYCRSVGFQILALIPFWKPETLEMVEPKILMQSKNLYPNVTINDLITQSWVLVLLKSRKA